MSRARTGIEEVTDERTPRAARALRLLEESFPPVERQPTAQIAMEIAEKRMGLPTSQEFHLLSAETDTGESAGVAVGVYLAGINAGFVTYLAVRPGHRDSRLGRRLRTALVEAFRADARAAGAADLAWVVGEVRLESPWLRRLVRDRAVVPFDLTYYHPGVEPGAPGPLWVLYRQPVGDPREEISAAEVRQLLYAVWRRAYRVRWPLELPAFRAMLAELEGRDRVGARTLAREGAA